MHDEPRVTIQQQEVEFQSHDGLVLRGSRVVGPGRPKAIVILKQGYGVHTSRYAEVIEALAASRFVVWAIDPRRDGRSDDDGALGPEFSNYLTDVQMIVDRARQELPGRPIYLLGHSLGGLIAFAYALDHQEELDGVVLLAPALRFRATSSGPTGRLLRRFALKPPRLPLGAYIPGLRSKKIGTEGMAFVDPLVYHGWIRSGRIVSLNDAGAEALRRASEMRLPILTMHGDEDKLIDPEASKELYRAIGVRKHADNSLITWPGMGHELLNEVDGEQVVGVILGWLNGHYTEWRKVNPTGISKPTESP